MSSSDSEDDEPSELGTHQYWEAMYKKELHNLQQHGDVGEIW